MKFISFFLGCLFLSLIAFSQQTATTEDGKKVLLKKDGTWEAIKLPENNSTDDKSFDFRKTKWGMTKKQVKASENGKIVREDERGVVYEATISGLETYIYYIFAKEKLVRSKYIFINKHSNKTDYIRDLLNLKEILIKKYGEPKTDDTYWKNNLYRDDPDNWGMAISVGHLAYYVTWEKTETEIYLVLKGENYEISLNTEYMSKKYEALENEMIEEKKKSEF